MKKTVLILLLSVSFLSVNLNAGKEGERRQIKVRTTEADLVVKARDSYIYSAKGNKFTQITGNKIDPASPNFRD